MKTLVVYYSRTGTTRQAGQQIAKILNADVDEIIDEKKRKGIIGYLSAGRDAMKKSLTKIKTKKDPKKYDLIIIGTPVWGWSVTPAVRTYLSRHKKDIKKAAFFCTMGSSGSEKVFRQMKELSQKPLATLALTTIHVKKGNSDKYIKKFIDKLKK